MHSSAQRQNSSPSGGEAAQADVYSPSGSGDASGGLSDLAGTGGGDGSGNEATAGGGLDAGGATGRIDSPLLSDALDEVGKAFDTGTEGTTSDAGFDAPLGGSGGSVPDGAIGADTTNKGSGGQGGSGTGGKGTGGSGTGGSGTGGSGTGGATVSTSGLVIYYPCDQTSGSTLTDSSGSSRNATLVTGTGGTVGYSFGTGQVNNALRLVKASQGYATIANTGLNTATEMTIAAWVYLNSSVERQRVWDFGDNTTTYMFLSPKSSVTKFIRFGITTSGLSGEQGLDGTSELAVGHVAVVLGGGNGILYIDGQPMVTKSGMMLLPSALGTTTTNNYIGKSQYASATPPDPYLDGNIDEFRVYSRALTPAEISILAGK